VFGEAGSRAIGLTIRCRYAAKESPFFRPDALCLARQSAGRSLLRGRGKSGLRGNTVPDNVRRGRPQGQCHREQTAGLALGPWPVRVKGCGKSAPRDRQRKRHGKPHREQDQIGATSAGNRRGRFPAQSPGLVARGGGQPPSQRNDRRARGNPRPTEPGLQADWRVFWRSSALSTSGTSLETTKWL
jgi:hypothetical protein